MSLKGMNQVLSNLNREIKNIENRTQAGITEAALFIKSESQKRTPVVSGNLRASAFVVDKQGKIDTDGKFDESKDGKIKISARHKMVVGLRKTMLAAAKSVAAEIGYTAVYAVSVHENPRAGKTGGISPSGVPYKAPVLPSGKISKAKIYSTVGEWKFLENPLKESKDKMLKIIERESGLRKKK